MGMALICRGRYRSICTVRVWAVHRGPGSEEPGLGAASGRWRAAIIDRGRNDKN